jgi:soluble lytic murein transglycosylase-like protein
MIAVAALGLAVGDARAQNASLSAEVDAASSVKPRTPVMIVHETTLPQNATQPDAGAQKMQAKPAVNAASKPTMGQPANSNSAAPSPLVLPPASQTTAQAIDLGFESTGNPKYDELIKQSAARNGVDPNLIVAVMRHESGNNPRARSYKGAMGLMQLMPGTAARFGVTNFYDPAQNIEGGARYLRFLLDYFKGDVKLTLAGYNAGENAVVNYGYTVPPYRETRDYVRAISARYDRKKIVKAPAQVAAVTEPAAPSPTTFSSRAGSRLSNNY